MSGSSTSNSTQQADSQGIIAGQLGTSGRDEANAQGGNGNYNVAPGAAFLSGLANLAGQGGQGNKNIAPGGFDLTNAKEVTVNAGLTEDGLKSLVTSYNEASANQAEAFAALAEKQQAQIGTLAENAQTGESKTKNTILGSLAALAILALAVFAWRKVKS